MLYKKNWITYLGYTIFALFLSGLFIINSQLYNNFSENNLVLLISVFICSELIVLVLYLISLITSIVNNKIKSKTSNVIYYIIWWTIFLIAILIRAGYIMYYVEKCFLIISNRLSKCIERQVCVSWLEQKRSSGKKWDLPM